MISYVSEQIENEENVLVCLRIIIELHKQFRPPLQSEASHTVESQFFEPSRDAKIASRNWEFQNSRVKMWCLAKEGK